MTDRQHIELDQTELRQKINLETGQLSWPELQKYFAKGNVIVVDSGLDLIDVAARFAEDDKTAVAGWIDAEKIRRALDDDARQWDAHNSHFWTVVVAPWILVQEMARH